MFRKVIRKWDKFGGAEYEIEIGLLLLDIHHKIMTAFCEVDEVFSFGF